MSDHVYKKIEIIGSSKNSLQEAIENAIARAAKTIRQMRWFEVVETRGYIEDNKIAYWQATVKIGFNIEDESEEGDD
jgi:flavin-binding protein dodecin